MAKEQYKKIPRPADFEPETHFPDNWAVKGKAGKPRCPAWSGQQGQQCKQVAGFGTDRLHQEGACCKYHGGASNGAPKGNTNAVEPSKPHSKYIAIEDIEGIRDLMGKDVIEQSDLLSALTMHRIQLALGKESAGTEEDPDKVDAKLAVMGKTWTSLVKTKIAAQNLMLKAPEPEDETLSDDELKRQIFGDT